MWQRGRDSCRTAYGTCFEDECTLGARCLMGMGTLCKGTLSLSAEPEAQLEEQMGKSEGGEHGRAQRFPQGFTQ